MTDNEDPGEHEEASSGGGTEDDTWCQIVWTRNGGGCKNCIQPMEIECGSSVLAPWLSIIRSGGRGQEEPTRKLSIPLSGTHLRHKDVLRS